MNPRRLRHVLLGQLREGLALLACILLVLGLLAWAQIIALLPH